MSRNDGFPTYTQSAKKGNQGVRLVSRIVSDQFGWLFRQIHQEEDFGIDGHLEIVTVKGSVTGRMIAAQIKFGQSFVSERNKWGYVYRGEKKHFNYLANCPMPVIICICNPVMGTCYWVRFEADKTQITPEGWKITIPFDNVLTDSQPQLEALVPPIENLLNDLKPHWELNKKLTEAGVVAYHFGPEDVLSCDTSGPRALFDRLRHTKELAYETIKWD